MGNNYTPTILFSGGSAIDDPDWGDYAGPAIDTWTVTASRDCQRLTPEPLNGSQPHYEQDDDMIDPRTMGQFIILATGKILLLNGGPKGSVGYALSTKNTAEPNLPFGHSLATSTAMLLPDGSVIVTGLNVNLTTVYTMEYPADIFFPSYFSASLRPSPQNIPKMLSYGGFNHYSFNLIFWERPMMLLM